MFSRFFIERPVFASVISLLIVLAGAAAAFKLPIAQFPDIVPPTVKVSTSYPGANAETVAKTVATPVEEQVNGVDDMIYMSSNSSSDGSMSLTVTFEVGTDPDMATVLVQNRVAIAEPRLPSEVKRQGLTTKKQSTNLVLLVNLYDPTGQRSNLYLSNYNSKNIKDVLARVEGVGEARVMDSKDFGMRLWLNPRTMAQRKISVTEVIQAIQEQNVQVAAGRLGQTPAPEGQVFNYILSSEGRLENVEEFENIILRVDDQGRTLRLKDLAEVELGAQSYTMSSMFDGKASSTLGIYQTPGANALKVAQGVRDTLESMSDRFHRDGLEYSISYDSTDFVEASISEVVTTLFIAVVLVVLTVYLFLQDFRAALVPTVTIPVSLVGTFFLMQMMGFSINTLTLFGLVLVIGIVVDDAIVVVENTMRLMEEEKLPAKEASKKAMVEVSGPVIATTLVLMAVFVPTAMLGGIVGQLYKQFALTIAGATVISSICALTLSPAMCGLMLRSKTRRPNRFFRLFNQGLKRSTDVYVKGIEHLVRLAIIVLLVWAGIIGGLYFGFQSLPTGFIPEEDQGVLFVNVTLPDAASLERTQDVLDQMESVMEKTLGVEHRILLAGYSMIDDTVTSNKATAILTLTPWDQRTSKETQIDAITRNLMREFSEIPQGNIFVFNPPAIPGLGVSGGFQLQLLDQGNAELRALGQATDEVVLAANEQPDLMQVNTTFRDNVPQYYLEIDRVKAKKMGVSLNEVFATLQGYLGSYYVNDFNKFDRVYKVMIQAEKQFRARKKDIGRLKARNRQGSMIPLDAIMKVEERVGPEVIKHYNLYPTAQITGQAPPGTSSGAAISKMETLCGEQLPESIGYDWTGMSYQEVHVGNTAIFIFALALAFGFLVLAAQYESWTAPLIIMMSVPLAVAGAIGAVAIRMMDVNVYTQIGLVLLIGLSAKNAILIVEFARQKRIDEKLPIGQSAIEASRVRFRPILMTALSFILGVLPLVIATGAGAMSRRALGTAVFGGMLSATFVGIFFIPILYVIVQYATEWRPGSIRRRKQSEN